MPRRTTTGCITCRIRRVKCDEAKPSCDRCVSSGRTCDGYIATGERSIPRRQLATFVRNLDVLGPVSRAISQRPSLSSTSSSVRSSPSPPSEEAIFFDIFRRGTVPSTSNTLPSETWQTFVLQIAHVEAAVWHAVVAVGCLHQCMHKEGTIPDLQRHNLVQRGVWHYDLARALSDELKDAEKVLTQKLALISAANMLDRHADAQGHILSSLSMISSDQGRTKSLKRLEGTLKRMEVQAMTFSESSSPYPFASSAKAFSVNQWLGMEMSLAHVDTDGLPLAAYDCLATELFGITRALFILDDGMITMIPGFGPHQTLMAGFFQRLTRWEDRIDAFENRIQHTSPSSRIPENAKAASLSIRMYHATLRTLIAAHSFGSEDRWDQLLGNFEYIVLLASMLQEEIEEKAKGDSMYTVSLEPGFVIPLWMVIHRCRHHAVRHQALEILSQVKRVEGIWRSDATATVLAAVVLEEEGHHCSTNNTLRTGDWLSRRRRQLIDVPWAWWRKAGFVAPGLSLWSEVPTIAVSSRVKDILATTELGKGVVHLNLMMSHPDDPTTYGAARHLTVHVAAH